MGHPVHSLTEKGLKTLVVQAGQWTCNPVNEEETEVAEGVALVTHALTQSSQKRIFMLVDRMRPRGGVRRNGPLQGMQKILGRMRLRLMSGVHLIRLLPVQVPLEVAIQSKAIGGRANRKQALLERIHSKVRQRIYGVDTAREKPGSLVVVKERTIAKGEEREKETLRRVRKVKITVGN